MKNKLIVYIIIALTVVVCLIGSTYAYFGASTNSDSNNVVEAGSSSYSLNLSVNRVYPVDEKVINYMIPMKDEYAINKTAYNNKCFDKTGRLVCFAYDIFIDDISDTIDSVSGYININSDNISNLKYLFMDDNGDVIPLYFDGDEFIYSKLFIPNENMILNENIDVKNVDSLHYTVLIWLSDNDTNQNSTDIGNFSGSITFNTGVGGKIKGSISAAL